MANVAPSELMKNRDTIPGVSFALRTYPRLSNPIAFAIQSQYCSANYFGLIRQVIPMHPPK